MKKRQNLLIFLTCGVSVFDKIMQFIGIILMLLLASIVIIAVFFRYTGNSLVWYDELASVLLVWLSFYGAVLAVLRNKHLSFETLLRMLPKGLKKLVFTVLEIIFIVAFATISWGGWRVISLFADETLIALPKIPLALTQSIVWISGTLIIIARLATVIARYGDLMVEKASMHH